jgi:copper chaperone CopZ
MLGSDLLFLCMVRTIEHESYHNFETLLLKAFRISRLATILSDFLLLFATVKNEIMKHHYIVSNMTCSGCIAKVKSQLLMHPDITEASVILEGGKTEITMVKHLRIADLQQAIGRDSKYKISADTSDQSHHTMKVSDTEDKSWLATYKPLLLIAAFIAGVSVLTANGSLHIGMNSFMAGFFLVFSFFKLLDLKGFANSYAMYDLLAMKLPAYGFIYPFLELALGVAFLTGFNPLFTNWATIIVMGFSSIGVIRSVLNKQKIQCACLGAVFNLPMSTVTIIEDLLMVAMAAYMLVIH